jgi:hypothetical protein
MVNGGLFQDATQMKLDALSAMNFIVEAWRLITFTAFKNCFVKCGFYIDHVGSIDNSAVKHSEDEEDDWHSLQPRGVQSEDYTTCDSAPKFCVILRVDLVLDQHFTRLEEEEEIAEHKATFLDVLKGLEAVRKYMCKFDTENNIIVVCYKAENEVYRLKAHERKTQTTLTDWLKKQ